ncbi:MAG: hypothetical protein H6709_14015 [Kofleriaceae bacterium]|nr:hypothetical protein [Kofleriaceae bacterium]
MTVSAPSYGLPTPARDAIAGAMEQARTAPPGTFRLEAVSLKPAGPSARRLQPTRPPPPTAPPPRVKLRPIADAAGGRTFSVAPGQLGYLAPPKGAEPARSRSRTLWWILLAVVLAAAAGVGLALAL